MYDYLSDYKYSTEWVDDYIQRVEQLIYLLNLKKLGFEIMEYFFGSWSYECCEYNPFLKTAIMVMFNLSEEGSVIFDYQDFQEWIDENSQNGETHYSHKTEDISEEGVLEIVVFDSEIDPAKIPEIIGNYKGDLPILDLRVSNLEMGRAWVLACDPMDVIDYEIADFFLHMKLCLMGKEETTCNQ